MRLKSRLDLEIARDLGVNVREVTPITRAFIEGLRKELAREGEISIEGFGRFRVTVEARTVTMLQAWNGRLRRVAVPHKIKVHFSKSPSLKALLANKLQGEKTWNSKKKA
jgi:nucleoid DNA-binding protein